MGGMHGFGPAVWPGSENAYDEPWEPRVFALSAITGGEGLAVGSGRATREEMDAELYLRASYYERWLWSTERRLEGGGAVALGEVDAWVERLAAGEHPPSRSDPELVARTLGRLRRTRPLGPAGETRFAVGDRVRVRRMRPDGHTRCPRYVRGAVGTVRAIRGSDPFPDIGPYRGAAEPVYAVAFDSDDLFGPSEDGRWVVLLDLFETYLEAA
jgi:nitrile hydratase subunit beta